MFHLVFSILGFSHSTGNLVMEFSDQQHSGDLYDPSLASYVCPVCLVRYKKLSSLNYHMRNECSRQFVCLCGVRRTRKSALMNHIRTHHAHDFDAYKDSYRTIHAPACVIVRSN